jgi:hypothetical protein
MPQLTANADRSVEQTKGFTQIDDTACAPSHNSTGHGGQFGPPIVIPRGNGLESASNVRVELVAFAVVV